MQMNNNIIIKKSELLHQVNLRTHYHAESAKRKDLDADTGESSYEDSDLMNMFLQKSTSELISGFVTRFKYFSFKVNKEYLSLEFHTDDDSHSHLLPVLKQAIYDYLVNELMIQWLIIRQPTWCEAYIAMRSSLKSHCEKLLYVFCNKKVRRRPTDFAGI